MLFTFKMLVGLDLQKFNLNLISLGHHLDVGKINVTQKFFSYENVNKEYNIFEY